MSTIDMNRRVSVIIPCFNQAHYLAEAIQSVLDQSYKNVEIIVVDDGSTDNTRQVVEGRGNQVLYLYQSNRGLSAARNAGLRVATGEYVAFLDSDDLWHSEFLATLLHVLEYHQEFGAVYCGSQFVDAHNTPLPQFITRTVPPNRLYEALVNGEFFPVHAVLVRKRVLDQVGFFDESLHASEDWDMWLRVSAQYTVAGVSQVLAFYRVHGDNMSRDLTRMRTNQLQVVTKHFGPGDGDPTAWSTERQRAFAAVCLWQGLAYYQQNENERAFEQIQLAFTASPDMVKSLDTFYMLACANQANGYVGDTASLNLNQNALRLLQELDTIFAHSIIPPRLRSNRSSAYGMAYFALGILAYRKRRLDTSRRFLVRAVLNLPRLATNSQWQHTLLKSLLGDRLLNALLEVKRSIGARRQIQAHS